MGREEELCAFNKQVTDCLAMIDRVEVTEEFLAMRNLPRRLGGSGMIPHAELEGQRQLGKSRDLALDYIQTHHPYLLTVATVSREELEVDSQALRQQLKVSGPSQNTAGGGTENDELPARERVVRAAQERKFENLHTELLNSG